MVIKKTIEHSGKAAKHPLTIGAALIMAASSLVEHHLINPPEKAQQQTIRLAEVQWDQLRGALAQLQELMDDRHEKTRDKIEEIRVSMARLGAVIEGLGRRSRRPMPSFDVKPSVPEDKDAPRVSLPAFSDIQKRVLGRPDSD